MGDRPPLQRCGARLAARVGQADMGEWFGTMFRLNRLVLLRCSACHFASVDSAGRCCRDVAHGKCFQVYRPDFSKAIRRDEKSKKKKKKKKKKSTCVDTTA